MQHLVDNCYVSIVFGFEYSLPNLIISSFEHSRRTVERALFDHVQSGSSNSRKLPPTVFQNTKFPLRRSAEKFDEKI